ncbi:hypothetical protein L6R50_25595 [Myxococcota bacterium]|nr:hypothetical protein [Myxococcota bacterium]
MIRSRERTAGSPRAFRGSRVAVLALGLLGVPGAARAEGPGTPEVTVRRDGTVEATVTVPATEAAVRRIIEDPVASNRLTDAVLSVEVEDRGRCKRVATKARGFLRPLTYITLRCPTVSGVKESLMESGDFSLYESEWQLTPRASGTEITYRIRLQVSIPAPRSLVNLNVQRSVREALVALQLSVTR